MVLCFGTSKRIEPQYLSKCSASQEEIKNDILSDFRFLKKVFRLAGVEFFTETDSCVWKTFCKLLHCLSCAYIFYLFITDIHMSLTLSAPLGFLVSACSNKILVLMLRIVLCSKIPAIVKSLDECSSLRSRFSRHRYSSIKRYLIIGTFVSLISSLVFFTPVVMAFTRKRMFSYEVSYFFGWTSKKCSTEFQRIMRYVLLFMAFMELTSIYVLPGFTVLLHFYHSTLLKELEYRFLRKIRRAASLNTLTKVFLNDYAQLEHLIKTSADSTGMYVFFLYTYMMCTIFEVSALVSNVQMGIMILHEMTLISTCATGLVVLISAASAVNDVGNMIKSHVHTIPGSMIERNEKGWDTAGVTMLLLLSETYSEEAVLTGWRLFAIKRFFMATTIGAIMSYGIILVQIGR